MLLILKKIDELMLMQARLIQKVPICLHSVLG